MNNPLISVIVPLYNCEKYIRSALESVFKQNYSNIEVIVINDGSTDQSLEIVKQLNMDITIISQENQGPAAARNTGIKRANGQIIAFIDSDDLWADNFFEILLPELAENSPYHIVRGKMKRIREDDHQIIDLSASFFDPVMCATGLYKSAVFKIIGLFDQTLRQGEDIDWVLRFNESSLKEKLIDETVLFYRRHQNNMTNLPEVLIRSKFDSIRKKLKREKARTEMLNNV